ncbi:pleckstrin homology domain-containing family O member 1b [Clupea harengus]|uniref:Pleckstrin homology domain-containing family O member 1b n=1 Tax=Clupea harengus TaxID=7950 RepID=A0A6P3WAD9_CLUHA|nr:pleckstrin homology domain-containing family O member 1b [Clupea harengus]
MKKNNSAKRGPQDANQQPSQPDKVGWIRKFCGKGIFREIWKNRFVVLKGDHLYISEKEVKDEKKIQEVVDLTDYERSEELRKAKSRSKKNHSKFTLLRSRQPGNTVPNLVFLAVSPEEKESWINALNGAITKGKNRILDEVTVEEDSFLAHPTRDRAKIPHTRRLPTRGHLMAVASTSNSDGMLTLDLIHEEDAPDSCEKSLRITVDKPTSSSNSTPAASDPQRLSPDSARTSSASTSWEAQSKSQSLPRQSDIPWDSSGKEPGGGQGARTPQPGRKLTPAEKSRCASMDEILSHSETRAAAAASRRPAMPHCPASAPAASLQPISQLQDLICQKLERTQELLTEVRGGAEKDDGVRAEAERLLEEATSTWGQARDVLEEVKELRALCKQLDSSGAGATAACGNGTLTSAASANSSLTTLGGKLKSPQQTHYRKSLM